MTEEEPEALSRRREERLATLAALARPVQHEINNLLTVIFANLEMVKRTAAPGAPQRQLDRVQEAARRFEASTRAILSLSRRPPAPGAAPVPLAEAVAALRPLLLVLLPAQGALTVALPEDGGWPVRIDRARLDEALIRLGLAAAEGVATLGVRAGLAIAVADREGQGPGGTDAVELSVQVPAALVAAPGIDHALAALRDLAAATGGRAEEAATEQGVALRLLLPRHAEDAAA